jgi:hypothetical protein
MNYTIIVLVFIIFMMMYLYYLYVTNTTLTSGVESLNEENDIKWTKLQNPSSSTYHYEGWVFIKDKPDSNKRIYSRGNGVNLYLNGTTLKVVKGTDPANASNVYTTVDDFPLQKWVYFVINVVNGNIIEVYLNGKLVVTKQYPTGGSLTISPPMTKSSLEYGQASTGINGHITKLKRDPVALTPDEVWKKYLEGNGLANFSNFLAGYNASFSLYNTIGTIKQFTVL